jgi:uridine phosphorylase
MSKVFHLGLDASQMEGATLAIVPGSPERVEKIAQQIGQATFLHRNREYTSFLAWYHHQPVVVCSTGIGGPSTSIAIEELAQLGIKTFLRVGTTGAIQPHIQVGDMIISQASVRLDGASQHFAPLAYPAAADFYSTSALVSACVQQKVEHWVGITASSDTFYPGQERYDTVSQWVLPSLQGSMATWQQLGVLNYEMESATLFTQCASLGLQAACLAGVILNRHQQEIPDPKRQQQVESQAIQLVIDSLDFLAPASR